LYLKWSLPPLSGLKRLPKIEICEVDGVWTVFEDGQAYITLPLATSMQEAEQMFSELLEAAEPTSNLSRPEPRERNLTKTKTDA